MRALTADLAVAARVPSLRPFLVAGYAGRLSYGIVSAALLLAVQAATDSFAVAGAAVGAFGLTSAGLGPLRARAVDRYGATKSLRLLAAGYSLALLGVTLSLAGGITTPWVLVGLSALAGCLPPPLGPVMRVAWASAASGPGMRDKVYALDSTAEEALFVAGPLLVAAAVLLYDAVVALGLSAILLGAGATALTWTRLLRTVEGSDRVAPAQVPGVEPAPRSLLGQGGLVWLLIVTVALGFAEGSAFVLAPAKALSLGAPDTAAWLLAVLSTGSVVGGLLYGARTWHGPRPRRLLVLAALAAAALYGLGIAGSTGTVVALLLASGILLAPTVIVAYTLADQYAPPGRRVEATTWVATASNAGTALGGVLGGILIEGAGPVTLVTVAATAILVLVLCSTVLPFKALRMSPYGPVSRPLSSSP